MRKLRDVKLEDQFRDKVGCTNCKVDVHTFFGDIDPSVAYICMHHDNFGHTCTYYGDAFRCPIQQNIKDYPETTSSYKMILNKLEAELTKEENKYPLTEREKLFANTIKEILKCLDVSLK